MQNEIVLLAPKTGTTEAASSEVQPMTRARFEVDAYIWRTAGTASAGSPRVSTDLQFSLWPSTPPAVLMALVAASHETRYVGPRAASVPVNGATSATVRLDPLAAVLLPPLPPLPPPLAEPLPQPATATAATTAAAATIRPRRGTGNLSPDISLSSLVL